MTENQTLSQLMAIVGADHRRLDVAINIVSYMDVPIEEAVSVVRYLRSLNLDDSQFRESVTSIKFLRRTRTGTIDTSLYEGGIPLFPNLRILSVYASQRRLMTSNLFRLLKDHIHLKTISSTSTYSLKVAYSDITDLLILMMRRRFTGNIQSVAVNVMMRNGIIIFRSSSLGEELEAIISTYLESPTTLKKIHRYDEVDGLPNIDDKITKIVLVLRDNVRELSRFGQLVTITGVMKTSQLRYLDNLPELTMINVQTDRMISMYDELPVGPWLQDIIINNEVQFVRYDNKWWTHRINDNPIDHRLLKRVAIDDGNRISEGDYPLVEEIYYIDGRQSFDDVVRYTNLREVYVSREYEDEVRSRINPSIIVHPYDPEY